MSYVDELEKAYIYGSDVYDDTAAFNAVLEIARAAEEVKKAADENPAMGIPVELEEALVNLNISLRGPEEWKRGGSNCDHPDLPEFRSDGSLACKHCGTHVDKLVQRELCEPPPGKMGEVLMGFAAWAAEVHRDYERMIAERNAHVEDVLRLEQALTTARAELDRVREERDEALRERDAYSAQIRADLQDAPRREREWLGAPTPEVHETARELDEAEERAVLQTSRALAAERERDEIRAAARAYLVAIDMHAGDDYSHTERRRARMGLENALAGGLSTKPPPTPEAPGEYEERVAEWRVRHREPMQMAAGIGWKLVDHILDAIDARARIGEQGGVDG